MRLHHANIGRYFTPNDWYVTAAFMIVEVLQEIEAAIKVIGKENSNLMIADLALSKLV